MRDVDLSSSPPQGAELREVMHWWIWDKPQCSGLERLSDAGWKVTASLATSMEVGE